MKLQITYFLMILLILCSCSKYEKDDSTALPPGYLKVPMGTIIKTELWNTILDARQAGITSYKWKTTCGFSPGTNPDSPLINVYDTGTYTVIFNNGEDSSKVIVYPRPLCYIPNSFSPNREGPSGNDKWIIRFEGISTLNLKVFSTDNIKLYESCNLETLGWDGTYNRKLCPVGYYYYYLKYTSAIGKEYIKTGYFQLLN